MRIGVVHLSDLHLRDCRNIVEDRAEAVVKAIRSAEYDMAGFIVCVTGDVAFSGRAEEYMVAHRFFNSIKQGLEAITSGIQVEEAFVPGNHDCAFPERPRARKVLIEDVLTTPPTTSDDDLSSVENCLRVQDDFFDFLAKRCPDLASVHSNMRDRLLYSRDFDMGGHPFCIHCYNTAFLSQRDEHPAKLLAPIWLQRNETSTAEIVLTMFHHPYGWLEPDNAKEFRRLNERASDVLMTGHEHVSDQFRKQTVRGEDVTYIEGSVLQDSNNTDSVNSGFNVLLIDLDRSEYRLNSYTWKTDCYSEGSMNQWCPFERNTAPSAGRFTHTKEFAQRLNDPGAPYTHPNKADLVLSDIFIFPDMEDNSLQRLTSHSVPHTIHGEKVYDYLKEHHHVLVIGGDKSGKSAMARTLCRTLLKEDSVPVLVTGDQFKDTDISRFRKVISNCICAQYGNEMVERFHQLDRTTKVLIVDDFHKCRLNRKGMDVLLETAVKVFATVVLTVSEVFSLDGFTEDVSNQRLMLSFRRCKLQHFGHRLRHQLLERWYGLGLEYTASAEEIAFKVRQAEHLVNTILRDDLLPSQPFLVLAILQSCEAVTARNTEHGAHGYHYEVLITDALTRALKKVQPSIHIDTFRAYLAQVAYRMFVERRRFLSQEELREVTDAYKHTYAMLFNDNEMWNTLESAALLGYDCSGRVMFRYRFLYPYFVAKYIAANLYTEESGVALRQQIAEMTEKLYVEEYANVLIFLVYLTKDEGTISRLVTRAKGLYADHPPCDFHDHVAFAERLCGDPIVPRLESGSLSENNERVMAQMDEAERINLSETDEDDDLYLHEEREFNDVLSINVAFKALQLMGEVVRNFPGTLTAERKLEIVKESYLLGLRALTAILVLLEHDIESVRSFVGEALRTVIDVPDEIELGQKVDRFLHFFVQSLSYGLVKQVSQAAGSEYLQATYQGLTYESSPVGFALIDLCIKLDHFRHFPGPDIDAMKRKTYKNGFAYGVLQRMVRDYFYLYPAKPHLRESMCKKLGIGVNDPKMLGDTYKKLPARRP